jgi:hypothetical protein
MEARPETSTPIDYIALTRDRYDLLGYPPYQWAKLTDTPPWTPLARPLAESTVALIGSGGAYREGQTAFHWKDDTGVRRIPSADPATDIRVTHFAYDLEPAREDPNIVFPVDRLPRHWGAWVASTPSVGPPRNWPQPLLLRLRPWTSTWPCWCPSDRSVTRPWVW